MKEVVAPFTGLVEMILLFRAENADNAEGKEVKSKRIRGFLLFSFPFFSALLTVHFFSSGEEFFMRASTGGNLQSAMSL